MKKLPTVHELFDITGKVFLVAGGGRDLGKDMALALAEAGATGVITSRNGSLVAATAGEISKATGKKILGLPLDAAYENEVETIFKAVIENFGHIDILVNCVGGGALQQASAKFEDSPLETWEGMHQLNVHTTFLLCKHAVAL
ncbi:MAG TPA: SDR family NAD(P)-dependent oxidoreductase, partial [Agriterribacter sp.]|nr:SDR family NAD(P)-dependent oxidoreductase [Agriterribacter sp.]